MPAALDAVAVLTEAGDLVEGGREVVGELRLRDRDDQAAVVRGALAQLLAQKDMHIDHFEVVSVDMDEAITAPA